MITKEEWLRHAVEMHDSDVFNGGLDGEKQDRLNHMDRIFKKYIDYEDIHHVLDFGGAKGDFVFQKFNNATKYVYDLDETPSNYDCKKINFDQLSNIKWDFIQCCHVLEHLSNPLIYVHRIVSLMPPGGYLYVEVPFTDLTIIKNPIVTIHEHINFFTLKSFDKLFQKLNMKMFANEICDLKHAFGRNNQIISTLVRKV